MMTTHQLRPRGFSLVEMLFVLTIISILIAVAGTGAKKSWESQEIKASALRLSHDIALASQTAMKLNRPVHLMFFKFYDTDLVAEQPQYRAYQIMSVEPTGQPRPVFEVQRLEGTTLISSSRRFSSALGAPQALAGGMNFNAGGGGGGGSDTYEFTSIEFRPDGSTNLDPDEKEPWTITLIPVRYADRTGELPREFRTLVITPENGSVRMY